MQNNSNEKTNSLIYVEQMKGGYDIKQKNDNH